MISSQYKVANTLITTRELEAMSTEDQLKDIRHRLFKIENKLDNVLFHHGHYIINPNASAEAHHDHEHSQEDDTRSPFHHMMTPFGGGYAIPAGILHPGMMTYGNPYGMFYGAGNFNMAAVNHPGDQSEVQDRRRRRVRI